MSLVFFSLQLLGTSLEKAEWELVERRKEEAVATGASTRASEHLRTACKQLRSLEIQSGEMAKQLEDKRRAAEDAAGMEFKTLEEAAKKAQEALTEAQTNLAVSSHPAHLSLWINKEVQNIALIPGDKIWSRRWQILQTSRWSCRTGSCHGGSTCCHSNGTSSVGNARETSYEGALLWKE